MPLKPEVPSKTQADWQTPAEKLRYSQPGSVFTKVSQGRAGGGGAHYLLPGDSSRPQMWPLEVSTTACWLATSGIFPPGHTRLLSRHRGQGRGHFGSSVFVEPALAWEQSPLAPGGFTVWVPLLLACLACSCSLVCGSQVTSSRKPFLCACLSLPPSHCSEIALAMVTFVPVFEPPLGQDPLQCASSCGAGWPPNATLLTSPPVLLSQVSRFVPSVLLLQVGTGTLQGGCEYHNLHIRLCCLCFFM